MCAVSDDCHIPPRPSPLTLNAAEAGDQIARRRWPPCPGKWSQCGCTLLPSPDRRERASAKNPWNRPLCTSCNLMLCVYASAFLGGSVAKEPACQCRRRGFNPGLGRSPGERNGNPLQYSCMENPMGRGAWQATIHGAPKSWTGLGDMHPSALHCLFLGDGCIHFAAFMPMTWRSHAWRTNSSHRQISADLLLYSLVPKSQY